MLWFYTDGSGGWIRMETRLSLNNLRFLGESIPAVAAAMPETMADLANLVKHDYGLDVAPLQRPMSFSNVLRTLEDLGLIRPTVPRSAPRVSPQSILENRVSATHRAEVLQSISVTKLFIYVV